MKGLSAVLLCKEAGLNPWWVVVGALLSVFGHSFSVFLKFKGGKGVATGLGMVIGLDPVIAGTAVVGWGLLALITRYISVASILASVSVPVQMFLWEARGIDTAYKVLAAAAALMIVLKHASNIKRLAAGTESRIGQKVSVEGETGGDSS